MPRLPRKPRTGQRWSRLFAAPRPAPIPSRKPSCTRRRSRNTLQRN